MFAPVVINFIYVCSLKFIFIYFKFYKKENTTTRAKFCEGKENTLRSASGLAHIMTTYTSPWKLIRGEYENWGQSKKRKLI
jgi:hypothetical protein